MYGRAEEVTGRLTTSLKLNDGFFLATKVWTSGISQGEQQMQSSISKMGRKRIDLMQVHNLVDWKAQLQTIRRWKDEGRARYDGITHYTASAFAELERVMRAEKPDFLQIPYSIELRDAEKRLLPLAAELGIGVIVNRPFEGGGLFSRVRPRAVPPAARELGCHTWAQVFLKFILARPEVTVVIPATSKVEHIRENLAAGQPPFPDAKQREALVKAAEAK